MKTLFLYFSLDDAIRVSIEISKLHHKKNKNYDGQQQKKIYFYTYFEKKTYFPFFYYYFKISLVYPTFLA